MEKTWLQKRSATILLSAALAWGVVGVLLFEHTGPLPYRPLEHLFMALAISGVLGLLIEFSLHRQIAKDVFEAAIGYLLPQELRDELRWIAGSKFMCVKHTHTVTISRIEGTILVAAESEVIRLFKNITSEKQDFQPGLGVWERFNDGLPSKILSFVCHPEDGARGEDLASVAKAKPEKGPVVGIGKPDKFWIPSGKHITTSMVFQETLCENDWAYSHFGSPTSDVTVIVKHPDDLEVDVRFSHRDSDPQIDKVGPNTWHLKGALLPLQGIRIYWFRKDKYAKWLASFQ